MTPKDPQASASSAPLRSLGTAGSLAILFLVGLIVFGRIVTFDWIHWDDNVLIFRNPTYLPVTAESLGSIWTTSLDGMYNPLTRTLWGLEAWIGEHRGPSGEVTLAPWPFHAGSLVLHLANVALAFLVLRKLVPHERAALFGALLFAIHPLQVEPVGWISETKGVLLGFFALLAIWQYLLSLDESTTRTRKRCHYALALVAFLLASLSKSAAVSLPLVLLLIDRFWYGRSYRAIAIRLGPWFLLSLIGVVAQKAIQPDTILSFDVPVWKRPLVMLGDWLFYLRKLLLPMPLAPFYDHAAEKVAGDPLTWLWSLVFLLFVLLAALLKSRRIWLLGIGIAVAFTLPYSGLLLHSIQRISTVNDRYMYLAMLGPAFSLTWFLSRYWSRSSVLIVTAGMIALGVLSFRQVGIWRNDLAFFDYAVQQNPQSATALKGLAFYEERQGNYAQAAEHLRQAIEQDPKWSDLHFNLGVNLHRQGNREEAIAAYRRALLLRSDLPEARKNLAIALLELQRPREATLEMIRQLEIDPSSFWAAEHLGVLLLQEENFARAAEHYRRSLERFPTWKEGYANLGIALAEQQKFDDAATAFRRAIELDPSNQGLRDNLDRLEELRRSR